VPVSDRDAVLVEFALRLVDVVRGCRDATDSEDGQRWRCWPLSGFASKRCPKTSIERNRSNNRAARGRSSPTMPTGAGCPSTTPNCPPGERAHRIGLREAQITQRSAEGRRWAVEESMRGPSWPDDLREELDVSCIRTGGVRGGGGSARAACANVTMEPGVSFGLHRVRSGKTSQGDAGDLTASVCVGRSRTR
jgi:hypothetical protein